MCSRGQCSQIAHMASRVFESPDFFKSQISSGCMGSMDIQMLDAFPSFSADCENIDNSGSLGSDSFFDAGKLVMSSDGPPSESPSACESQEMAMSTIATLQPTRKRSKVNYNSLGFIKLLFFF